jgi:putative membrane protein
MQVYLILALLVALLVTVFAVQNNAVIAVTLFAWRIEGSLAIILMGTLLLGILVGVFLITPTAIRGRLAASDLRKKLQKSEQDLDEARRIQLFPPTTSPAMSISDPELNTGSTQGEGESGSLPSP